MKMVLTSLKSPNGTVIFDPRKVCAIYQNENIIEIVFDNAKSICINYITNYNASTTIQECLKALEQLEAEDENKKWKIKNLLGKWD